MFSQGFIPSICVGYVVYTLSVMRLLDTWPRKRCNVLPCFLECVAVIRVHIPRKGSYLLVNVCISKRVLNTLRTGPL